MQPGLRAKAVWQTLCIQHNFTKGQALVALCHTQQVIRIKIQHGRNASEIAESVADLCKRK
jgi:hypothetical protein